MRRIPLSRRSHVIGFQPLPTGSAEHESALERDFVTLASFKDAGATITSQPVTISFMHGDRRRRYTPDFRVDWSDGLSELVEVKYWADLRAGWARLKPGFVAGRAWSRENGMSFRIASEREIRGPLLEAAKRLLPLRTAPIDLVLAEEALVIARSMAQPTFGAIVDRLSASRTAALAVVWRLIARGILRVELRSPIDLSTLVFPT